MGKTVGFLIFEGVAPLDFIGPWDVMTTWSQLTGGEVTCLKFGETMDPVSSPNNITFTPDHDFSDLPHIDILVIPGAQHISGVLEHSAVLEKIGILAEEAEAVLTICTGAFILQGSGAIQGKQSTTYWRSINELEAAGVQALGQRIVQDGKFWSGGGVTSGIDLAFAFIAATAGKPVAGALQLILEYFPPHINYAEEGQDGCLPPYVALPANEGNVDPSPLPEYIKESYFENQN